MKKILLLIFIGLFLCGWSGNFGGTEWGINKYGVGVFGSGETGFQEGDALLLESGDYLLLESGDKLLLET